MQFKDQSNSWDGKQLKAIIHESDTQIIEVSLYYRESWNSFVKRNDVVLHVSRLRKDGEFYTGGIGEFYVLANDVPRKTIKLLWDLSTKLDEATIYAYTNHEAVPTLIV